MIRMKKRKSISLKKTGIHKIFLLIRARMNSPRGVSPSNPKLAEDTERL